MREAGGDPGPGISAASAANDPSSGKADKDMKGLVYQGGEIPTNDPYQPDSDLGGAKADKAPVPPEGESILNFTEKDSKTKAIALFLIAVVVIIGIAYLVINSKMLQSSITISTSTSTISSANAPTTTMAFNANKSAIFNIDVLYNYTGPSSIGGVSCLKSSSSKVETYTKVVNASSIFYLYMYETSGRCALTITKISATTKGFRVMSVNPTLPIKLPANSSDVYIIMKVAAPSFNYTGPLSLTINEK